MMLSVLGWGEETKPGISKQNRGPWPSFLVDPTGVNQRQLVVEVPVLIGHEISDHSGRIGHDILMYTQLLLNFHLATVKGHVHRTLTHPQNFKFLEFFGKQQNGKTRKDEKLLSGLITFKLLRGYGLIFLKFPLGTVRVGEEQTQNFVSLPRHFFENFLILFSFFSLFFENLNFSMSFLSSFSFFQEKCRENSTLKIFFQLFVRIWFLQWRGDEFVQRKFLLKNLFFPHF